MGGTGSSDDELRQRIYGPALEALSREGFELDDITDIRGGGREVGALLLRQLLKPEYHVGVIWKLAQTASRYRGRYVLTGLTEAIRFHATRRDELAELSLRLEGCRSSRGALRSNSNWKNMMFELARGISANTRGRDAEEVLELARDGAISEDVRNYLVWLLMRKSKSWDHRGQIEAEFKRLGSVVWQHLK